MRTAIRSLLSVVFLTVGLLTAAGAPAFSDEVLPNDWSIAQNYMHQPTSGVVTSRYNDRCPGFDNHAGIDIANAAGTRIRAAYRGTVIIAETQAGYGRIIYIRHNSGYVSRYAHLQSFAVSVGQSVTRDQLIGHMGASGNATGPHLHFEVRRSGNALNLNDAYRCGQSVSTFTNINHYFELD